MPVRNAVQTTEKISVSFQLEVTNKGGHSSVPAPRQCDLSAGRGPDRLSKFSFPVQAQRDHARLLRAHRRARGTSRPPADMRASHVRQSGSRRAVAYPPVGQSGLQRATAHHLRRDDAGGRPRGQRAAAACARHRQLPHHAGRAGRGGASDADPCRRRRADHGHANDDEPVLERAVRAERGDHGGDREAHATNSGPAFRSFRR